MSTEYETQGYTINNAGRRLVVDPITRIEGHMRCEVNINDQNVITNAVSCGTMFAGLEIILQGRDPRDAWAFVERICGVCTGVHALASVYAIEDAIGAKVPDNANIIRNIMSGNALVPRSSGALLSARRDGLDRCVRWAESRPAENLRTGAKSLLMAEIIPWLFLRRTKIA